MRALILAAGAALSLGACGNNDQADNSMNVDENLTAENIVSNDVTAIDAVTGAAANMAADINYMEAIENLGENVTANGAGAAKTKTGTAPRPRPPRAPSRAPRDEPAPSDTSSNNAL